MTETILIFFAGFLFWVSDLLPPTQPRADGTNKILFLRRDWDTFCRDYSYVSDCLWGGVSSSISSLTAEFASIISISIVPVNIPMTFLFETE